jgi:hypothetical protein
MMHACYTAEKKKKGGRLGWAEEVPASMRVKICLMAFHH